MPIAWLYLRHQHDKRYELFTEGLKRHGFKIENGFPKDIRDGDIFVSWNRLSAANRIAQQFDARDQTVLIAENASWGNSFHGEKWFHIARRYHNTAGCFAIGENERWDKFDCELKPFRNFDDHREIVILPQRGIGTPPTVMPSGWAKMAQKRYGGRVRLHPGKFEDSQPPLEKDLKHCGKAIVWGSGAGIKCLMMGIPVTSEMPNWIGSQNNTNDDRLRMFRELAWAQWSHDEIVNGFAFERLLSP